MTTSPSSSPSLRRDFASRADLIAYLKQQFPEAAAMSDFVSPIQGGHTAARDALNKIDPVRYEATRNHLDGAVTRLSPYIRHGVLSLAEVRDAGLVKAGNKQKAYKFVDELARRDFFQRVYQRFGDAVLWADREPYKTGFTALDYADTLPADILNAQTGRDCIDAFATELHQTGYLHNHARMYLAAYVIHHRRVKWQAGARWFLTHLLDGDPASNNLSWQWVASTFSHKPYFFNRENLERYTAAQFCPTCPLKGRCDFEGSYEQLERRLFPRLTPGATRGDAPIRPTPPNRPFKRG